LKDVVVSLNREQIDTLREDWGPSPKRCLRDCHKGWYKHRGRGQVTLIGSLKASLVHALLDVRVR
jgi:hypothetical protein